MRITNYERTHNRYVFTNNSEKIFKLKHSAEIYFRDNYGDYIPKKEFIYNIVGLKFINYNINYFAREVIICINFKNQITYMIVIKNGNSFKIVDYINKCIDQS